MSRRTDEPHPFEFALIALVVLVLAGAAHGFGAW